MRVALVVLAERHAVAGELDHFALFVSGEANDRK
jgi:hypothetical protein